MYLLSQIEEIQRDKALRVYGALLAFLHSLGVIYLFQSGLYLSLVKGSEAVCWPFFEKCYEYRFLSESQLSAALVLYALCAVAVMYLFLRAENLVRYAYFGLISLNLIKFFVMLLDFRTRMNHHYMIFFVTIVFLFLPKKKTALQILIILFYFWAGFLKCNREWLSGSALYGELWLFKGAAVPWACAYVLVLEMLFIWGLLSKRDWVKWGVFSQLLIFHLFSFPVVGFFYPCVMYVILAIYPLSWLGIDETQRPTKQTYAFMLAFSLLQLISWLYPGDKAITGEGRHFALNMFDARIVCESEVVIRNQVQAPRSLSLRIPLPIRLRCDPIVYLSRAKQLCESERGHPGFIDLDLSLRSRRTSDPDFKTVVDVKDFCTKDPQYSLLLPNDWIQR